MVFYAQSTITVILRREEEWREKKRKKSLTAIQLDPPLSMKPCTMNLVGLLAWKVEVLRPAASPEWRRCPVNGASLLYNVNLGLIREGDCGRKEIGRCRLKKGASLLKQPRSPKHSLEPGDKAQLILVQKAFPRFRWSVKD